MGQTLIATLGTWSHKPTSFWYQWANSKGFIAGATQLSYVPVAADVGLALQFFVIAINSAGQSAYAKSAPTGAVLPATPVNTALPTISGTAQIGQTLSASTGGWTNSPTSFAYQWSDSATGPIGGATASAYVPTSANLGHTLTVSIVASNAVGPSAPATSAATSAVIDIIPTLVTLPTISGTAQVGQTLTAFHGTWTHNPTSYTYQWGNTSTGPIPGATGLTYVPTSSDVGFQIVVSVVAHNSGGNSASIASAATAVVIASSGVPVNTGLPVISGTAQIGQTLSASTGGWTNSPTSFAYQWSDSATGPIGGATASAYVPTSANLGHTLTVSIVASNAVGPSAPATSAATSAVIDIIPTLVTLPTISGTAQVGQTLTATTGAWTHNPTSYSYQWTDSATGAISGATANTYVPASGNVGHTLTVSVIATNSGGSSIPATSAPTGTVTGSNGGILDFSQASNSGLISAIAA